LALKGRLPARDVLTVIRRSTNSNKPLIQAPLALLLPTSLAVCLCLYFHQIKLTHTSVSRFGWQRIWQRTW